MTASAITCSEISGYAPRATTAPPCATRPTATTAESGLLARLRRGDARAFDELVRQNHAAMIRLAMGYVGERAVAEEVVQDTWMAAIDALDRFEGRSSLRTWICGILIHKAKDRGARERRHFTFSDFESFDDDRAEAVDPARFHACGDAAGSWALPPQPWDERTPEHLLASKQAFAALDAAVDALPAGLRDVLILKDVEGLETGEICRLLKITESNLYVRLHRARERVRQSVATALEGRA